MATSPPLLYSRVVASFAPGVPPAAVDAVIELAHSLGAELLAVLLEDAGTLALAELPSPRAFDARGAAWRDLERTQLLQELERATAMLRRRLDTAHASGVKAEFTVIRGAGAAFAPLAQAGDLLVVSEPADPMARWVQPFAGLLEAALATPAALLYLPQRVRTRKGAVAALGVAPRTAELARGLAQSLAAPRVALRPSAADLRGALSQLRAQRVRVVVCDRAALGPQPRRALQQAGDERIAVLIAPEDARSA